MTKPTSPAPGKAKKTSTSAQERRLERLGLTQASDFVVHLPLRYEDETRITPIARALPGQHVQIEGHVSDTDVQYRPRKQLTARMHDASGIIALRWLHFYPSQVKQLESGKMLRARGEVRRGFHGLELVHPRITRAGTPLPQTLTPVYPTTEGLSQDALRRAIDDALGKADLSDTLPSEVLERYKLIPFEHAIRVLHHPPATVPPDELIEKRHPAWQRIKFDELLAQQLTLAAARAARREQQALSLDGGDGNLARALRESLSFKLTAAQARVIGEISADLKRTYPMHRLLQGDVGSGKTIVAAFAAVQAIASGSQVAIMAPTEILSEQHAEKFSGWLTPLGITVVELKGSLSAATRRERLHAIAQGQAQLVVGTQALIQEHVQFERLGLVIMDEQHRFGVGQRLTLSRKGDQQQGTQLLVPHQLNMSATPIPRTLAMTFLADLDVSVIDELPPGRTPVVTKLVDDTRRDEVLGHILNEVRSGRQVYWVCPLVEESEALQLQTAVDTYERLTGALSDARVGLVHGRMSATEKHAVMQAFRDGELDVLVATTVIEVGVDVPQASLMVIEHAERFGLAQLHQLRGRVGRGSVSSICVLLYQSPLSQIARQRLRAMYETDDGFEIARRDLALRGPGEFLGMRQSGPQLLRFADLEVDEAVVEPVREAATLLRARYPEHANKHINRWMRGREELIRG
ncbi:MAG TPA: ATP-dependent DNA helicase RecG [Burkholderiaceae bacterium]|nr:ATP-dependent DNA helicase RecG [Burkholderiaceae bacterium]